MTERHGAQPGLRRRPAVTVLVTGGTGFLGTSLARRLLADGARVRVLARSPAKAEPLAKMGAEIVLGDINDQPRSPARWTAHRWSTTSPDRCSVPGIPAEEYGRTHVTGTKLLLDCCEQQPGLRAIRPLQHDRRPRGDRVTARPTRNRRSGRPTPTSATKAAAEAAVRARWGPGFPAVIVRPGLVYGPGDLHLLPFFQSILRHRFRPIGRREAWLHPIYIDDMTEALVRCGEPESGHRRVLPPRRRGSRWPLGDLARPIAEAEGTRLPPGHPVAAAWAVAALGDRLPAALRQRASADAQQARVPDAQPDVRRHQGRSACSASPPRPTCPPGLARTVAWYRQSGYLPLPATASRASSGEEVPHCGFGITS